jgi:AcrR family transcriptional regulator
VPEQPGETERPEPETPPRRRGRPPAGVRAAILAAAAELIREDGIATLTTRGVATRAGVSEASVFYHFQDKTGLLQQVVLAGLTPLKAFAPGGTDQPGETSLEDTLLPLATALESFFDHAMPVLAAIQSDASLRDAFAERLVQGDLGPHRGVQLLSQHLSALSARGLTGLGTDPEAASLLLIGACFLRSWERQMTGGTREPTLPALPALVDTFAQLLAPPAGETGGQQGQK